MTLTMMRFSSIESLPRIDYLLTLGEDPKLERITPDNAYDLPYIRLVYRRVSVINLTSYYELVSVEVVDANPKRST